MKNKLLILFITALCTACGNFLEPKSKSEFVPKDVTSLNELLLGEAYPTTETATLNLYLGLLDDDINTTKYYKLGQGESYDPYYAVFTWQPDMYETFEEEGLNDRQTNLYLPYYEKIRGANAVLDYMGTVSGSEEDMKNVEAQALALRSFFYFQLINIFGQPYCDYKDGLGVPLKLTSEVVAGLPNRATVSEVYEQIISDFLKAEALYEALPQKLQWKANYRTNLPMVQLMLSRCYLYTEQWENAAKYAKKVMDNTQFSLFDLNSMTDEYAAYHQYNNSETIWPYGNIKDYTNWILLESDGTQGQNTYHIFKASDDLVNSFDANDLRKTKYLVPEKHATEGKNIIQAFGKMEVGEESKLPLQGFRFARSIRLSEAYLNYAEAKAMLFKEGNAAARTEAEKALTDLRTKRMPAEYATVEINNADELVTFTREERRRELCFENHRWFDLRRYGMPEIKHTWHASATDTKTYTLKAKDPAYTLPLPPTALEQHTGMQQNPLAPKRTN